MSDTLWQGLELSVMGMGLTFTALGLLIVAMVVLERVFRPQPPAPIEDEPDEVPAITTPVEDSEDEEIAAAIAVALTYLRSLDTDQSQLGATLEAGHGRWWATNRVQRRASRRTSHGRR